MAILSFQEKQLIEKVFGMGGGYVLNFTNREFEEFMKDVVSYNIYQKHKYVLRFLLSMQPKGSEFISRSSRSIKSVKSPALTYPIPALKFLL